MRLKEKPFTAAVHELVVTSSESGYPDSMTMWMAERDPEDADDPNWQMFSVST